MHRLLSIPSLLLLPRPGIAWPFQGREVPDLLGCVFPYGSHILRFLLDARLYALLHRQSRTHSSTIAPTTVAFPKDLLQLRRALCDALREDHRLDRWKLTQQRQIKNRRADIERAENAAIRYQENSMIIETLYCAYLYNNACVKIGWKYKVTHH